MNFKLPRGTVSESSILVLKAKAVEGTVHFDGIADYNYPTESCTVALVTHGVAGGGVSTPKFIANWRKVIDDSRPLLDCLNPNNPQGGYTPLQCKFAGLFFIFGHLRWNEAHLTPIKLELVC